MKKVLLFSLLFFIGINNVIASTSSASAYILMDEVTGRVLSSKNMNTSKLIASITKIMTCVLAIESNKLDDVVVVDDSINGSYGSGIYIEIGEELTLKDLLYGLMLRSGNDAALMVANYISDSTEEFVKLMNNKAKELGMKNTIFNNPSGLDNTDNGNYSTVYDMALLTKYAMKYPEYEEIVGTKSYTLKTNKKTYIWKNKNKLLNECDYITGGKTGYTEKAHRTLVTTASKDNMNLIVVTLNDGDDWNTHKELYNYAFNNYVAYKVLDKEKFEVVGETYYKKELYVKEDIYIPFKKSETRDLVNYVKLNKLDSYSDNDKVGNVEVYLDKDLLYIDSVYVRVNNKTEKRKSIWDKIREILS